MCVCGGCCEIAILGICARSRKIRIIALCLVLLLLASSGSSTHVHGPDCRHTEEHHVDH